MADAALDASWTLLIVFAAQTLSWAGVPAIGTAVLGAAGVLASQGTVPLWPLLVAGIAGAQCGGLIGWKLGRDLAAREADREHKDSRLVERSREAVRAGRELEQRYGGVMVLFVSSWISGSLGLQLRRFFVWNLIAATLWTLASVLGAYGIGTAVSNGSVTDPLALIVAAAAIALLALAFRRRRRNRRAAHATVSPRRG